MKKRYLKYTYEYTTHSYRRAFQSSWNTVLLWMLNVKL